MFVLDVYIGTTYLLRGDASAEARPGLPHQIADDGHDAYPNTFIETSAICFHDPASSRSPSHPHR